jgi:hypothetical protein
MGIEMEMKTIIGFCCWLLWRVEMGLGERYVDVGVVRL